MGAYADCQEYAAGAIDRDTLIWLLARRTYRPSKPTDGFDWMTGDSGEFYETVTYAYFDGLIDEEIYEQVITVMSAKPHNVAQGFITWLDRGLVWHTTGTGILA